MTREGRRRNLNLRLRAERDVLHARRGNKRKLLVLVRSCAGYRVLSVLKHAKTLRVFGRELKGRDELLAVVGVLCSLLYRAARFAVPSIALGGMRFAVSLARKSVGVADRVRVDTASVLHAPEVQQPGP